MQQKLNEHWRRAQAHEAIRDLTAAQEEYAAMLGLDAQHIPAHLRMSRLEQLRDRYRASRQHALHAADAIRLRRDNRYLGFVSLRLLDFSEDAEVASVILSADWSDPEVLRQAPVLAQHLWLAGRYDDTLRFLDAIEPKLSPHPLLLFTRANVLRYLGRIDEAAAAYEASLALRPGFADVHWAIATHTRAEPPRSRIARLELARAQQAPGSMDLAHAHYALFHELDAAGDTEAAWSTLTAGAALMANLSTYDAGRDASRLEELLLMGAQDAAAPSMPPMGLPVPVFVVGMPRTGTTLLDRILGNHPQVMSAGERNDFVAAVSEAADHFFRGALAETDLSWVEDINWRKVGVRYLQRLRQASPHGAYVIDKNPQNLFNLPLILRALPQARVLCLRRDPMDACFSNLKELFQGGAYAYSYRLEDLAVHCRQAHDWMRHWASAAPQAVKMVDYETLVTDVEATGRAVLDFIGLPHVVGLHDITRNTAPVATASSSQVREPVHARGVGAWRRYAAQLQPLREALAAERA